MNLLLAIIGSKGVKILDFSCTEFCVVKLLGQKRLIAVCIAPLESTSFHCPRISSGED